MKDAYDIIRDKLDQGMYEGNHGHLNWRITIPGTTRRRPPPRLAAPGARHCARRP